MSVITVIRAQNRSVSDDGVVINGIKWATRNVETPGTFARNPWDFGLIYTFDSAQEVCPIGWRTPTAAEFGNLLACDMERANVNGVAGHRFYGDDGVSVFFPATGNWNRRLQERMMPGSMTCYWTSTSGTGSDTAYVLYIAHPRVVVPSNFLKDNLIAVRCVAR